MISFIQFLINPPHSLRASQSSIDLLSGTHFIKTQVRMDAWTGLLDIAALGINTICTPISVDSTKSSRGCHPWMGYETAVPLYLLRRGLGINADQSHLGINGFLNALLSRPG